MRASTNDGGFCCFLYRLQIGLFLLLVAEPLSAAERGLRAVDHGLHRELRIVFYRSNQLLCKKVARSITLPWGMATRLQVNHAKLNFVADRVFVWKKK